MKPYIEPHIKLSEVIKNAGSGRAGKICLVESDGVVVALCPDYDRNMIPEKLRLDLTELFIDICMKELSFGDAIKKIGHFCMASGVYVWHIEHSSSYGVTACREQYED